MLLRLGHQYTTAHVRSYAIHSAHLETSGYTWLQAKRTLSIPREHIMRQPQQLACVLCRGLAHRQALVNRVNLLPWDGHLRSGRSTGHIQSAYIYSLGLAGAWCASASLPCMSRAPTHLPVFLTRILHGASSRAELHVKAGIQ